ncbi:MAG: MOSC domain-containing protein [Limisphaerales bacterium]
MTRDPEILHLYVSPGHNYFGHHEQPAGRNPVIEVDAVDCVAGQGLRGDRFFGFKPDYKGQVTFFAFETYLDLCRLLNVHDRPPSVFRRNVITRGLDLNSLVGREFGIQGIRFGGMAECSPCHWMNGAFAPGAERALHGRGGLRARILTDGSLRVTRAPQQSSSP